MVASPCASPYADSATDVYAAVPQDGSVKVSLAVGQHLVVGWSGCNMAGRISVPDGEVLRVTDGQSEYRAGPQVNVRYLAEKEGTVDVTGQREGRTGRITVVVQHR